MMNLPREKILELLVERATDVLTLMTTTGEVLYESGAIKEVYGYEAGELIGKNVLSLIHPMDLPEILKLIAEGVLNPGKQYRVNYRFKAKDGGYISGESTATYVIEEGFKGVVVVSRRHMDDVGVNKRLEEIEAKYAAMFEDMPAGFSLHEAVYDGSGKPVDYIFLGVNRAFESMTGLKRGDLLGRKVTQALPGIEKDPFDWIGKYGKLAKEGGNLSFDTFSQNLKRWYVGNAYGLAKNQFAVVFTDVTDVRAKTSELEKLKLAIDNVTSHVVLTDVEGLITYANDAAARITGFAKEEMMGTKAGKLWSLPMPKEFYESLWQTIKVERKSFVGEIQNRRKGGTVYQAQVVISPIVDRDGSLVGFVGIEDDVTERNEAKSELEKRYVELERLNTLMVGRELKMAELKRENERLRSLVERR